MPLILPGNVASATAAVGYDVANSCRWNDGDSPEMEKTMGSGDRQKWTISMWIKRGQLGTGQNLWKSWNSADNEVNFRIDSNDFISVYDEVSETTGMNIVSSRKLRDVGAWYHIVFAVDTTQGTAANRINLYINGTKETAFSTETYPDQNYNMNINQTDETFYLGVAQNSTSFFDGYFAEVVFIDGTQYAASDFGEFDDDSPTIWKPTDPSGLTFGTNGFYLDFEASGNLGNDVNGGTDLSETNLAAADQATDTPTNSFCILNPLWAFANKATLSQGNCKAVGGGAWNMAGGTVGLTAGKWYWEIKMTTIPGGGSNGRMGVFDSEVDQAINGSSHVFQQTGTTWWYNEDGGEMVSDNTATTADYGELDQGDILGIALNMDDDQITIYDQNSASVSNFALSSSLTTAIPASAHYNETVEYNFGGCPAFAISSAANDENGYGIFEFAPPSGYLAICSQNLGSDGG